MNQLDREIQAVLVRRGHFLGTTGPNRDGVDGQLGNISKQAILTELKGLPVAASAAVVKRELKDPDAFFASLRKSGLFPHGFTTPQVQGINTKLRYMGEAGWSLSHMSYGMCTSYHETGARLQPVREGFADTDAEARRIVRNRAYGKPGRNGGQVAYGRGDVQLTWDDNYERGDRELGLNGALIANYDLALETDISARLMISGMSKGWYSRDKAQIPYSLPRMLPRNIATRDEFTQARRIINIMDKADLIAGYALAFQAAGTAGGWQ